MCGSDSTGGEEDGNRRNGLATHSTWPFTPVKTRPRRHGTKLVSDAADPCQLLDDGRSGVWAVFMLSGIASQNAPQNWAFATQSEI